MRAAPDAYGVYQLFSRESEGKAREPQSLRRLCDPNLHLGWWIVATSHHQAICIFLLLNEVLNLIEVARVASARTKQDAQVL